MNTQKITFEDGSITLEVNGVLAGVLEIVGYGTGAYHIENIDIEKDFRGMGYYKTLLRAAFQVAKAEMLVSDYRNGNSNPIYEAWTGQELEDDQEVTIGLFGEDLVFDVSE